MKSTLMWRYIGTGIAMMTILSGCGGGGSANTGSTEVEIWTDAERVAYQTGEDAWKDDLTAETTLVNGKKRYTFDYTGKYGVALYCKNTVDKGITLFQLTTSESRSVVLGCGQEDSASISGKITDTTSINTQIDGYGVAMGRGWEMASSTHTYTMNVAQGMRDLIVTSLDTVNAKIVPQRFYIERDIDFMGPDIGHDITLTDTNTHTVSGYDLTEGSSTKATVKLVTENDTMFTADVDGKWYVPDSGLRAEDQYFFYGESKVANQAFVYTLKSYGAENIPKQDQLIDATYVTALQGVGYDKTARYLDGLAYSPSAQSHTLRFYSARVATDDKKWYYAILSAGWLDGEESYSLPDLSGLQGFATAWQGLNAAHASISVYMSSKSIKDIFLADKVYSHSHDYFFLIPGSQSELAYESLF